MADNVVANAGSGGDRFVTANFTFSGDSAHAPGGFVGILSGSEGSWTYTLMVGGAGAVTAGVQRITLASDDPAVTSLAILDDWDESDRAKVNPIVGQAGVAAGAGAVGATTQRVTLASDDPAVTSVQLIDDAVVADDAAFTPGTTKIIMAGFEFDDSTPDSVNEGDGGAARMSANRCVYINIRDNAGNERGLNIDANGALAAVVTNAGTFATQAAQSGTWNITNVSGTVSLPTGASTLAEQQTHTTHLSNIATSAGLLDDAVVADDAAFTPATTKVVMAGFEFDDNTPDSVNEGDAGAGRMSANRCQYVNIRDNAGNERGLNIDANGALAVGSSIGFGTVGGSQPPAAVQLGAWDETALRAVSCDSNGVLIVSSLSTFSTQINGSALTALQLIDDTVFADDAAFTVGTSKVNAIGAMADESSTDSVDEGDVGIPRMTLTRLLRTTETPHTAGGLTMSHLVAGNSTNATVVKASAGQVYSISGFNNSTNNAYLKFYNKATAPNAASDTVVAQFMFPASGGFTKEIPAGLEFTTGIAYATTDGIASTNNTAVAASVFSVFVGYK